jgi:hypothetical protein
LGLDAANFCRAMLLAIEPTQKVCRPKYLFKWSGIANSAHFVRAALAGKLIRCRLEAMCGKLASNGFWYVAGSIF